MTWELFCHIEIICLFFSNVNNYYCSEKEKKYILSEQYLQFM